MHCPQTLTRRQERGRQLETDTNIWATEWQGTVGEVERENMKIENKPAARHQHVSNDSQTKEIGGGGSKVANLPTS